MTEKEKEAHKDVQVHVLKNGLYADRDEIFNHPGTKEQLRQMRELMKNEAARKAKSGSEQE